MGVAEIFDLILWMIGCLVPPYRQKTQQEEAEFGVIEFVKDRAKGVFLWYKITAKKKGPACRVLGEDESMRMHKHRADVGQCPGSYMVLAH